MNEVGFFRVRMPLDSLAHKYYAEHGYNWDYEVERNYMGSVTGAPEYARNGYIRFFKHNWV